MRRSFLLVFLPLLVFMGGLAAPAQAGTTSKAANVGRVATPTDAQLDATIRAKLAKSKIGKDGFRFKVARGVVTWEGNTGVVQHKGAATRMARTAGAVQVVNNIQISADAKAKAAAHLKKASVAE
jgi:osmotically-inducible protein OsmY